MRHPSQVDPTAGTPVSVEAAFRRVRTLAGALVLARLWTGGAVPHLVAVAIVTAFWSVNLLARLAERQDVRNRALLGVVQLLADTLAALVLVWLQGGHTGAESADWAVLVLPAIEGAVRFRTAGALASWLVVAAGYAGGNLASSSSLPAATIAQRLTVVLLVALPVGYLAEQLVAEIDAHRVGRSVAEQRSILLRAAALGGHRAARLDVDGILDVMRTTVTGMGFGDPNVFVLTGPDEAAAGALAALPVSGSQSPVTIAPGDDRLAAAAAACAAGVPTFWPAKPRRGQPARPSPTDPASAAPERDPATLLALPIPAIEDERVVLTVRCPDTGEADGDGDGDGSPPPSVESLELFAAQAGASLNNARIHLGLEQLKDQLDYQASHDALTDLPNRRRFADELGRAAGRGRPGDLLGVLFVDLDGFKGVNDRYGHETGNDLLAAVASRLRDCVRPGDLVARLGGDEFTIMLTRLESVEPAAAVAERVCAALSEPFAIGSRKLRISTSVGVALAAADRADAADLLRRADTAMYRAKSQGKARWSMDAGSTEKTLEIVAEIHTSPQGTCNDAPRTSQRRMEEM